MPGPPRPSAPSSPSARPAGPESYPPPGVFSYLSALAVMLIISNALAVLAYLVLTFRGRGGGHSLFESAFEYLLGVRETTRYHPWILGMLLALATLWTFYQWIAGIFEERRTRHHLEQKHEGKRERQP